MSRIRYIWFQSEATDKASLMQNVTEGIGDFKVQYIIYVSFFFSMHKISRVVHVSLNGMDWFIM